MGVTVAEGTEEVGVLDLLPVLLGVAATELDSEPSSLMHSGQAALHEHFTEETRSDANFLPITPEQICVSTVGGISDRDSYDLTLMKAVFLSFMSLLFVKSGLIQFDVNNV